MRWEGPDGYWASDDPDLIDVDLVHAWMSLESYWAEGRPCHVMAQAIQNSLSLGLYLVEGKQVGYARFVTDYATYAWLCDVFVDSAVRSRLGTFLVETAVSHPGVRGVRQVLMGEPGRSLYTRFWLPAAGPSGTLDGTARPGSLEIPIHRPRQPATRRAPWSWGGLRPRGLASVARRRPGISVPSNSAPATQARPPLTTEKVTENNSATSLLRCCPAPGRC